MMSPNLQAFLRVIRAGESSQTPDAYRMKVGGGLVESLADHPRQRIWIEALKVWSTAAGAYQFLAGTWDECRQALGLPDFSPESQDRAAVFLVKRRGALDDVEAGRIEQAITKCAKEWASLPGSPYGQPLRTMAQALATYKQYGGTMANAPIEVVTPVPVSQVTQPEQNMPISAILAAVLPSIIQAIPALGKLFGSGSDVSERNVKTAEIAVDIVSKAIGAKNAQDAAEMVTTDPEARATAQKAVEDNWYQMSQVKEASVAAARDFSVTYSQNLNLRTLVFGMTFLELLSAFMVTTSLAGALAVVFWGGISDDLKGAIVTLVLIGGYTGVQGFWFGSSMKLKTNGPTEQPPQ